MTSAASCARLARIAQREQRPATNVDYRLDTPQARAFLGQFVTFP